MRYLRLIAGMITGRFPTLDELYQSEIRSWKKLGFKSTPEWVDTWTEPGRIVEREGGIRVWEPENGAPVPYRCETCQDTHRMELRDRTVPCTHCPRPCEECASHHGTGAYCAVVWCACDCHQPRILNATPQV
jgi:hypothetical protein